MRAFLVWCNSILTIISPIITARNAPASFLLLHHQFKILRLALGGFVDTVQIANQNSERLSDVTLLEAQPGVRNER